MPKVKLGLDAQWLYLLRETRLDEGEESVDVVGFKRSTWANVFYYLFTSSYGKSNKEHIKWTSTGNTINSSSFRRCWQTAYLAAWLWMAQAYCWTHWQALHWREKQGQGVVISKGSTHPTQCSGNTLTPSLNTQHSLTNLVQAGICCRCLFAHKQDLYWLWDLTFKNSQSAPRERGYLQVVHHGCGSTGSLGVIEQGNGLKQVIHGGASNQGLQCLGGGSQGQKSPHWNTKYRHLMSFCLWHDVIQAFHMQLRKGYSIDIAPVSPVDQSSWLQRHWFVYQLHILN